MIRGAVAILAFALAQAAAAQNPLARFPLVSAPDCPGAGNIIAEAAREPVNETFVRVQNMGDRGTEELLREAANEVTWDVGTMTGLHAPPAAQRGYRDAPPPVAASAFQLSCQSAGFFINSSQFSHTQPLTGEGPSATVGRTVDPPAAVFSDARSAFAIDGWVAVPTSQSPNLAPSQGVTQVSFLYYMRDLTTNTLVAHVIVLHDNRPPGFGGSGVEYIGHDGFTAFAGSPLAGVDGSGNPVRFVEAPAYSGTVRYGQAWSEPTFFRAEVSFARFHALLVAVNASSLPGSRVSTDPRDYRLVFFGLLAEVFVGTTRDHEVMLGGHVRDLTLSTERREPRVGRFR